ncbi:lipin Ned1 [Dispira simplex]|nr:lipin Ned1 [Dispira simplex]
MQYVGKVFNTVSEFYKELNPSTLSGAIDIIVVERPDGQLACSPFHVRFGKFQLLRPSEKVVDIVVNGKPVDLHMKLGDAGEAFFVIESDEPVPSEYATSPILEPSTVEGAPDYLDLGGPSAEALEYGEDTTRNEGYVSAASDHELYSDSEDSVNRPLPVEAGNVPPYTLPEENQRTSLSQLHVHNDRSAPIKRSVSESHHLSPFTSHRDDRVLLDTTGYKVNVSEQQASDLSNGLIGMESTPSFREKRQRSRVRLSDLRRQVKSDDEYFPMSPTQVVDDEAHPSQPSNSYVTLSRRMKNSTQPLSSTSVGIHHNHVHSENCIRCLKVSNSNRPDTIINGSHIDSQATSLVNTTASLQTTPVVSASSDESTVLPTDHTRSCIIRREPLEKDQDSISSLPQNHDVAVSLCGWRNLGTDATANEALFNANQVPFSRFATDTHALLADPSVVIQVNQQYFTWPNVAPLLLSLLAYNRSLDLPSVSALMPKTPGIPFSKNRSPEYARPGTAVRSDPGENDGDDETSDSDHQRSQEGKSKTLKNTPGYGLRSSWRFWRRNPTPGDSVESSTHPLDQDSSPITDRPRVLLHARSEAELIVGTRPEEFDRAITEIGPERDNLTTTASPPPEPRHYAKTLRLTSEQLKNLDLRPGVNYIKFTVRAAGKTQSTLQETERSTEDEDIMPSNDRLARTARAYCSAKIFYWKHDTRLVISDIDGTITKSDALGHLFTMVGKDWTHTGVAKLYTDITRNGYQVMYLTSRAIGQADVTRNYLRGVNQGPYHLPDGPVIMSPTRLFESFHREVIARQPQVFKMACLRDIKNLFGDHNPFHAGFGNRITDALSYRSVNVPTSRIFTIDYSGEVKLELLSGYRSSYISLTCLVDQMFPPPTEKFETEYNDWNYWKPALPPIDDLLLEDDKLGIQSSVPTSSKATEKGSVLGGSPIPVKTYPTSQPSKDTVDHPVPVLDPEIQISTVSSLLPSQVTPAKYGESPTTTPGPSPPTSYKPKSKRKSMISRVTNLGGLLESLSLGSSSFTPAQPSDEPIQVSQPPVALSQVELVRSELPTSTLDTNALGKAPRSASSPAKATPEKHRPNITTTPTLPPTWLPGSPSGEVAPTLLDHTHSFSPPTTFNRQFLSPPLPLIASDRLTTAPSRSAPPSTYTEVPKSERNCQAEEATSSTMAQGNSVAQSLDESAFQDFLDDVQLSPEIDLSEYAYP